MTSQETWGDRVHVPLSQKWGKDHMNFLSNGNAYKLFEYEAHKAFYVDKSLMIDSVYRYAREVNKYICVTRPRRFGKTVAASMIAAFFDESTSEKSRKLFEKMAIGRLAGKQEKDSSLETGWSDDGKQDQIQHNLEQKEYEQSDDAPYSCWLQQGRHRVIHINMIHLITEKIKSYQDFCDAFNRRMMEDIAQAYPALRIAPEISVPEALEKTGDSFIFVIDEWDTVFELPFMRENDKQEYILLLKALLKDQGYVDFAYMTGILPIAKYSSGSPLNMFEEFSAFQDDILYPYFGLTREEIRELMNRKGITKPSLEELEFWYDGYNRGCDGEHVYNPASVSKALAGRNCRNYWTGTGPMNEIRDIIRYNVKEVREDVVRMVGGETLNIRLTGFTAEKTQIHTRDEILSAMVVYGFLTYYDEQLKIPNHELMMKFQEALSSEPLGLNQTLEESKRLLEDTGTGPLSHSLSHPLLHHERN